MPAGRNGDETAGGRTLDGRRGTCRKVDTLLEVAGEGLGPGEEVLEDAAQDSAVSGASPFECGLSDVDGDVAIGEIGEDEVSFTPLGTNVAGESDNTCSSVGS